MDESRKYKEQAETWRNRAAMAHRQGNKELTVSALDKMWQYLTLHSPSLQVNSDRI